MVWKQLADVLGHMPCDCTARAMQDGASCLFIASQKGHFEVVKHLCEIGGKELLMLTANVSGLVISDAK